MRAMILALLALATFADRGLAADRPPLDIEFVLDNSSSMQYVDPKRLLQEATKVYASRLGPNDKLGIVSFDDNANTLLELGPVSGSEASEVDAALRRLTYRGGGADLPGGLEAARHELDRKGRGDAQKVMLLIAGGSIDLGAYRRNRDRKDWLQTAEIPNISADKIMIFGIKLSKEADPEVMQRATGGTGGEYYEIKYGSELPGAFDEIDKRLIAARTEKVARENAEKEKADAAARAVAELKVQHEAEQRVLDQEKALAAEREREAEAAKQSAQQEQRIAAAKEAETNAKLVQAANEAAAQTASEHRLIAWSIGGATIAAVALAAIVLGRRRGEKVVIPGARLIDLSGKTATVEHPLKSAITRIGSLEGQDIRVHADDMSRTHAVIEYRKDGFYLRDLRSLNHTYLNEQPLPDSDPVGKMLKHGDEIWFARYPFRFVVDELTAAEHAPNPVKTTRAATGTVRSDAPGDRPAVKPGTRRIDSPEEGAPLGGARDSDDAAKTVEKPNGAPPALIGPDDRCDVHLARRAEARCSKCGGLICNIEDPVDDRHGGKACRDVIERGACARLPAKESRP